jgi:hypothetical protein
MRCKLIAGNISTPCCVPSFKNRLRGQGVAVFREQRLGILLSKGAFGKPSTSNFIYYVVNWEGKTYTHFK